MIRKINQIKELRLNQEISPHPNQTDNNQGKGTSEATLDAMKIIEMIKDETITNETEIDLTSETTTMMTVGTTETTSIEAN